jgi:hypothetical protein
MIVPLILFLLSAAAGLAAWSLPPDERLPLLAVAILLAGAGVALLVRRAIRPLGQLVLIDGSNVMHWGGTPEVETVAAVVADLKERGLRPVVWFDANAGYLLAERYLGPAALARLLHLPARQVFVAPKGTPADPLILEAAVALQAQVVTNDRYRDWAEAHPIVTEHGRLIRGRADGRGVELRFQAGAR